MLYETGTVDHFEEFPVQVISPRHDIVVSRSKPGQKVKSSGSIPTEMPKSTGGVAWRLTRSAEEAAMSLESSIQSRSRGWAAGAGLLTHQAKSL